MADKWSQLPKCPKERFSNIVLLNSDEFVLAPYNYTKQKSDGLLKYNFTSNKWSTLIKYPKNFEINNSTLSIDTFTSKLYLLGAQSLISCIDTNKSSFRKDVGGEILTGVNPSSLFLDGKLHLIGGSKNRKHLIRDFADDTDEKSKYDEIYEFTNWQKGCQNCGFIYIPSKKMLVLLGGYNQFNDIKYADMVWTYNLKKTEWKKQCKMPSRMCYFGYVLSADERYIVLLGGYTSNKKAMKKIHVLDTETMKFIKTNNISSPASGSVRAIITDSNDIHVFSHDNGDHWKINIKAIIQEYNDVNNNYNNNIVKKYKKLLEEAEMENRKLNIAYTKQKQLNEQLQSGSGGGGSGGNGSGGGDGGGMTKKMKKSFQEIEQKNKELTTENRKLQNANSKLEKEKEETEKQLNTFKNKNYEKMNKIKELNARIQELEVESKELAMIKKLIEKNEGDDDEDDEYE